MGNKSVVSLSKINCLSLDDFEKQLPRKMTVHILSKNKNDYKVLVQCLTGQTLSNGENELFEKDIKKKLNLYSFMNFKIYEDAHDLMNRLKQYILLVKDKPKSDIGVFSELIIVLNNDKIKEQIDIIKHNMEDDEVITPVYIPFIIFLSPQNLDIADLMFSKKTFHFRVTLDDIMMNLKNTNENEHVNLEVSAFFRKIYVIFSYFNELGDEFSFKTSDNRECLIKIGDDTDISVFMNVLLMGRSGSGKSTLINLLLDEKKSIEGGTGFSTTSKDIVVYKKDCIPLRFYDVKGIESEDTIKNYSKILKNYNGENGSSKDNINAILYCMEYTNGTIIEEDEFKLFENLIDYNIPIIFLITKTPYNPDEKCRNKKMERERKSQQENIKTAIKVLFKSLFNKKKKDNFREFFESFVRIYFVNLVRDYTTNMPPFGIDKFLKFFTESVTDEDWEKLKISCYQNNEENCKKYCLNNPFLKYYSDFQKIKSRNKDEALEYLKGLKAGAFFSGMVPGLDIGMEYYYRKIFKDRLKALYGFNYDLAEESLKDKKNSKNNEKFNITNKDIEERKCNVEEEEKLIEDKIDKEVKNKGRNAGAFIRGAGEIGGVVIKALPTAGNIAVETGATVATRFAVSGLLKVASWALFPITCTAF